MGLSRKAKVRFRGPQYLDAKRRFEKRLSVVQIGIPGSGKTMTNKMLLVGLAFGIDPETLTHGELDEKFLQGLVEKRYYATTGRSTQEPDEPIGAFVANSEIRCDCGWRTVALEGEEPDACPKCGSASLSFSNKGLVWRWGPLGLAMLEGKPFFWNEFSRCPQKTQDVMIPVLSEGYLSVDQIGETITAKDGFQFIADMNTEEHDTAVESFCWALGRRVRKVYYYEPTEEVVRGVLEDRLIKKHQGLIGPIMQVFTEVTAMYHAGELPRPPLVSGMLEWANDFAIEIEVGTKERDALVKAAELTWLPDVVGHNRAQTDRVKTIIETAAQNFRLGRGGKIIDLVEEDVKFAYDVLNRVLKVDYLGYQPFRDVAEENGITDYSLLWTLTDPRSKIGEQEGMGRKSVVKVVSSLNATVRGAGVTQNAEGYWVSKEQPEHWGKTPYQLGTLLREFVTEAGCGELYYSDLNDLMNRRIHTFADLVAMDQDDLRNWVAENEWRRPLVDWMGKCPDQLQNLAASEVLL